MTIFLPSANVGGGSGTTSGRGVSRWNVTSGPMYRDVTTPASATGIAGPGLGALLPPGAALRLLDGDGGAGALEGRLRLVGAFLVDLLQHRLGRAVDQVLGLLQAQARQATHLLD